MGCSIKLGAGECNTNCAQTLMEIKGKMETGRVGHLDRLLAGEYLEERASYLWEHCYEI